ncbi:MAG: hypothetical protein HPZ91_08300 [Lentisphaeria bacterium]|nr:hypothetical protein [Lentisphaeria bacterium]
MKYFPFILLLTAGCAQAPQWDTAERQAIEAELGNATTQLEMTGAAGELATIAEKQMIAALECKLSTLSRPERLSLLQDQLEWQRKMDRRNSESMGDGSIAPMLRHGREKSRLKNRFMELSVPEEVRQAFAAVRNARIRFQGQTISLDHGELDFMIPENKRNEFTLEFETIGQLCIPFCREIKNGKDTFHVGIIEPTNYHVLSSFGEGTESNLCVWKNGENTVNFLIGKKITIQDISISGNMIKVFFFDKDGKLRQKEFDYHFPNDNPVQINHWATEQID